MQKYQLLHNYCDCHHDCCCCNPWRIENVKDDSKFFTMYNLKDAEALLADLNADIVTNKSNDKK